MIENFSNNRLCPHVSSLCMEGPVILFFQLLTCILYCLQLIQGEETPFIKKYLFNNIWMN